MVEIPNRPITERSAWTAAELAADPGWIRWLRDEEIAALEAIAEDIGRRGLKVCDFARDDFDGAALADLARWTLEELERGRGCVLIKGLDVGRYDRAIVERMYWALGLMWGTPRHQNAKGDLIGEIKDHGLSVDDPLVRPYKTRDDLGFHCDGLDIVSLLCLEPAMRGGESQIASAMAVFNEILETRPDYLPPLFEGFHFNLRGEGAPGEAYPVTRNKVPVFSYFDGRLSCRLLFKAIRQGHDIIGDPLTGFRSDALAYMQSLPPLDKFRYDMQFEPGDIQILNNYVILHARAAFEDWPDPARRRNLLRMWMNVDAPRKLAPEFADRYNTGPREPMRLEDVREIA